MEVHEGWDPKCPSASVSEKDSQSMRRSLSSASYNSQHYKLITIGIKHHLLAYLTLSFSSQNTIRISSHLPRTPLQRDSHRYSTWPSLLSFEEVLQSISVFNVKEDRDVQQNFRLDCNSCWSMIGSMQFWAWGLVRQITIGAYLPVW